MRTFIILITCMLLLSACQPRQAEICFLSPSFDYDTLGFDDIRSHAFVFRNTGKAPLIIDHVGTSCGCTEFSYDKEPVMPNDTGSISVKYTPDAEGTFRKVIVVTSNAVNSPKTVLKIKGFVKNNF